MNYKKEHIHSYDAIALNYEAQTNSFLNNYLLADIQLFLTSLPGKNILDLGSGPGRDSLYFKEQGYSPLCIDISPVMIHLCKEKKLSAQIMDFEQMNFEHNSFDGVWAYTSLLHTPKKNIDSVLKNISLLLKPQGSFFIGMKEGFGEGIISNERGNRFFANYKKDELENKLTPHFHVVHSRIFSTGLGYNLINILSIKK